MTYLEGIRVLDLTDERGLFAGRILADLGADVAQVEPPQGSSARKRLPRPPGGTSYVWEAFAAGKRGIVADLDTPLGRQRARELAAVCDIVLENDGPAVQGPRGLDADDLRRANPGLVYVSMTPFGRTGPKASYAASDLTLWAAGGPLDEHRDGDRPPLRISIPQAWLHAASDAAAGALLALAARTSSGLGQLVDVSVQACLGAATLGHVLAHVAGDVLRDSSAGHALSVKRLDQSGSGAATDPTLKKWPCKDGTIEMHIGIGPASGGFTNTFLRWMTDEGVPVGRFGDLDFRALPKAIASGEFVEADTLELRGLISDFFAARTKDEVLDAAVERKLLCVPIFTTTDVRESKQLAYRDFFATVGEGPRRSVLPARLARVVGAPQPQVRGPAPLTGEHDEEVSKTWLTTARPATAALPAPGARRALPLEGLKVLDLSWVVAGPVIGRALADFGADVIRVESSKRIETARFMQPFFGGKATPESSALYGTWNAGKRGVTLDLQSEEGRGVARDLAAWADVVIESFSVGTLQRWGLDYESLAPRNPGLIMLSTSINGQTGPLARQAGFGNIGAALSGFQALVGWPDRGMIGPFGPYTDYIGPRMSLVTLLAALEHRRKTGTGCYIDVSQTEAGVWMQAPEIADNADNGTIAVRLGNADREHAPHGVYPTREPGRYVAIAVTTDSQWQELAAALGRSDLGEDPTLLDAAGRRARAAELDAAITTWSRTRSPAEVEAALQAVGVPVHVSASSEDFCNDPQLLHRRHLVTLPHALFGDVTVEGPRYLLSDTPGRVPRAAPTFGQHNREVLVEVLGYSQERVDELAATGVLE